MYIFGCLIDVTQYLLVYLLSGMYGLYVVVRLKKPLCYFSLKLEYTYLFFLPKKFATQLAAGAAVVLLRTARKQQQSHHIASEALGPGIYPKLILLESANIR